MASFDVVSEIDIQEVRNAVHQTEKAIKTRYDFRGSKSSISFDEKESQVVLLSDDELKQQALADVLAERLSQRKIDLKSVEFREPEKAGGDMLRQVVVLKQGLSADELKRLTKLIKGSKIKVSAQAQGDQLRVSGKKRDDLQAMISLMKSEVADVALQFTNFRE